MKREERLVALLAFDGAYRENAPRLAGMDEAGRGPLAGPVAAGCVILPADSRILWVDDSKKLSESRREKVYDEIMREAVYARVGLASPGEIDEINILNATRRAMERAAEGAEADLCLIDAVTGLSLPFPQNAIIGGDAKSYSIAAASILAKVTRDREMRRYDLTYPMYGFAQNKGYGTRAHIAALRECGSCPIHRRSFITHFI